MDIKFEWDDVLEKFSRNMRVAMEYGAADVAGGIAAMLVTARHAFDRMAAGEPKAAVYERLFQRHEMLYHYFLVEPHVKQRT